MTQYSYDGKNKNSGLISRKHLIFNIFFILLDLAWHSIKEISMVDSECLNFFKSQQATTTDFIRFYFLLH